MEMELGLRPILASEMGGAILCQCAARQEPRSCKEVLDRKPEWIRPGNEKDHRDGGLFMQVWLRAQRFFLNLYSTPTERAKLTSYWLTLGA
jgi:hypothetical protein